MKMNATPRRECFHELTAPGQHSENGKYTFILSMYSYSNKTVTLLRKINLRRWFNNCVICRCQFNVIRVSQGDDTNTWDTIYSVRVLWTVEAVGFKRAGSWVRSMPKCILVADDDTYVVITAFTLTRWSVVRSSTHAYSDKCHIARIGFEKKNALPFHWT